MYLRSLVVFLLFTANVSADSLETIRQQFEIYQRFTGELEILAGDNAVEIDNVLKRTETKRFTVHKELDGAQMNDKRTKLFPSPLYYEEYAAPFFHYVTVERAVAQRALKQGKVDEAMLSIRYIYYLADELADTGSLELRTVSARIRLQTLETVQSLLMNLNTKREHHVSLHKIFDKLVHRRPLDLEIWTLYRDEGKRFFEEVSRHGLEETVSPKLLKELKERKALDAYEKSNKEQSSKERWGHDQSVFRRVMTVMIESCELPFFQRQPVMLALDKELREQRGTETEPVFSLLLLRDVTETMRLFAQEHSGNEMAYLALSFSLEDQPRRPLMNFLSGKEYRFPLTTNGVMCTYEGNIKPFYVPIR
jgi:hypothetical protein